MRDHPKPQEIYRHCTGGEYQIITLAKHFQTGDSLVVYQALFGEFTVYARELSEFLSEYSKADEEESTTETLPNTVPKEQTAGQEQVTGKEMIEIKRLEEEKEAQTEISEMQTEETINIDPLVMEFLDADSYEERLNILAALHCRITDEMINTMSVAVDVEVNEGDIEERYEALKNCLVTLEKYECNRLR